MKKLVLVFLLFPILATQTLADGVAVVDDAAPTYFKLLSTDIDVQVENQVAIVTTTEVFKNTMDSEKSFKYAYPMPQGASATRLEYRIDGTWYEAAITKGEQDTTLPGPPGDMDADLKQYLGKNSLYFNVSESVASDSTFTVKLTYVKFLEYDFGQVAFTYPNDYSPIQTDPLNHQEFNLKLMSEREITSIELPSHISAEVTNNGSEAQIAYAASNRAATTDYQVNYALSEQDLGLFDFSTYRPDSLVPDQHGQGYFMFVAEPNPDSTEIVDKNFTLIVDRSGSMSGDKIVQARDAARFIVQRLNEGDQFNVISFNEDISVFSTEHLQYNASNEQDAINYIDSLEAGGLTNISGVFTTAISQFENSSDSTANIILFFTDGKATAGITNTDDIIETVSREITDIDTDVTIFNFGIGSGPNKRLLSLLAKKNSGLSEFLGSDELEGVITKFYLRVRNPVLLDTEMFFEAEGITEVYPKDLPNLYKGQQMIVTGRYTNSGETNVNMQGNKFGNSVSYAYDLSLSDSSTKRMEFLPKVWAKKKIEHLMVEYHTYDEGSEMAKTLKDSIQTISVNYGVVTDFTSFTEEDPPATGIEEEAERQAKKDDPNKYKLLGNYPNPFNPSTTIKFKVSRYLDETVKIRIYDVLGKLIRTLTVDVNGPGVYRARWDGANQAGARVATGTYIYTIEFGNAVLSGKMTMIK